MSPVLDMVNLNWEGDLPHGGHWKCKHCSGAESLVEKEICSVHFIVMVVVVL